MNILTTIINDQRAPIRVYIEPWGEGYTIQPDQTVAVRINNQGYQPYAALVVLPGGDLQIYVENTHLHQGPLHLGLYDAAGALIEPD